LCTGDCWAELGLGTWEHLEWVDKARRWLATCSETRDIDHYGSASGSWLKRAFTMRSDPKMATDAKERKVKELQEFLALRARAYATNHIPLQSSDMCKSQ
jgi:hypothetical protein